MSMRPLALLGMRLSARSLRDAVLAALLALAASVALEASLRSAAPGTAARAPGLSALSLQARESISAAIGAARRGYWLTPSGTAEVARNPAQRLRARFSSTSASVSDGGAQMQIGLLAYGAAGHMRRALGARLAARANRIEYRLPGLAEWFVNGPAGLEQGFTVSRAAAGGSQGMLTLAQTVAGSSGGRLARAGRSVLFGGEVGGALSYGALRVLDAGGKTLPSWLTLAGGRLALHVRLAGARFPITVDPVITGAEGQEELLREGGGSEHPYTEELFGSSVALSADGNTAIVGAPGKQGVRSGNAWVFARHGSKWKEQQELSAPEGSPGAAQKSGCEPPEETGGCLFGSSVALSADGDVAVVGDPPRQAGGGEASGAVLVYAREGEPATWKLTAELAVRQSSAGLGASVGISEDGRTVIAGAPLAERNKGEAFAFDLEEGQWSQGHALIVSGAARGDQVGQSVAISGDGETALVGAPEVDEKQGAAYTFRRLGAIWQEVQALPAEGEAGEGKFGESVALSSDGTTALVGAPRNGTDPEWLGAAWAYTLAEGVPQSQVKLEGGAGEALKAEKGEEFGASVALSGDGSSALVGAPERSMQLESPHKGGKTGAAWLFTREGSGVWGTPQEVQAAEEADKVGRFGASDALDGDGATLLLGSPRAQEKEGGAFLFGARPVVEELAPKHGKLTGGATVAITGVNLTDVTGVFFGDRPAESYEMCPTPAESKRCEEIPPGEERILAVAPAGEPFKPPAKEEVDVTVETPGWLSATTTADLYEYEAPEESSGGEEPGGGGKGKRGGGGGGGGSGSGGGSGDSDGGGNLPTGVVIPTERQVSSAALGLTTRSAPCSISPKSVVISVSSSARASLTLVAGGTGKCAGRISLRVKLGAGAKARTLTLASSSYSLPARHSETLHLKLSSAVHSLLRAHHGRLKATLVFARSQPKPARAFAADVTLSGRV